MSKSQNKEKEERDGKEGVGRVGGMMSGKTDERGRGKRQ